MPRGGKRAGAGKPKGYKHAKTLARERGRAQALKQAEITAARVVLELGRIAFADRRAVWTADGTLKPFHEWGPDEAALLEGFEVLVKNAVAGDGHTDTVHKVKLATKQSALECLAKHFGLLKETVDVQGGLVIQWES